MPSSALTNYAHPSDRHYAARLGTALAVTLVAITRIDELDLPARRPRMDDGRVVGQQTVEN